MTEQILHPAPHSQVDLSLIPTAYEGDLTKDESQKRFIEYHRRLDQLQEMLYASGKQSLLVVFQALDAGGKDGTIRNVFGGINPQGLRIASFKVPTAEELAHDFLWRIHRVVPPKGYIGVFNRSHYEDVLVVRVNQLAPEEVWRRRYEQINNFERLLAENGTHIMKFYLHISKEEQRERFMERLENPERQWKFSRGDLVVRTHWDSYREAYHDVFAQCNTTYAPWHIVPADRKWYRNYFVVKTIVEKLETLGLAYPPPEPDLDSVVIPD